MRSSSERSKLRESASATLFSRPGNHGEYSLMPVSRKSVVWRRAVSMRTDDWTGSASTSVDSLKFVLHSQPADVELSVIDRAQSPLVSLSASMSTHGVMIDAMYSRRLFDARNQRTSGTSKRHAKPLSE